MKTLLLLHGPNLNLLGRRDQKHYGSLTLEALEMSVKKKAKARGFAIRAFQSNHEGMLIDFLQKHAGKSTGVIFNPGALAHYSFALHDAVLDTKLPCVEVHLSDVEAREKWRRVSVIAPACKKVISGKKLQGYLDAVDYLANL